MSTGDPVIFVHQTGQPFGDGEAFVFPIGHRIEKALHADHEEIGSTSDRGAGSSMLATVLERTVLARGGDRETLHRALARSACLSADMAHATHPNYADRHDPQHQIALNGGPEFTFSEAISFQVSCETQDEVDAFWSRLSEGGEESMCGWLKDRYGVSWQVVPTRLPELLNHPDPETSQRVMQAMLEMKKIDIAALEQAAAIDAPR